MDHNVTPGGIGRVSSMGDLGAGGKGGC